MDRKLKTFITVCLRVRNGTGDLAISVLRPGDLTISLQENGTTNAFSEMGVNASTTNIQSYTLSIDIGREPIRKLGSRYAVDKPVRFPVNATLDVETTPGAFTTGSLFSTLCDDTEYDISISLRVPNCSGGGNTAAQYIMRKAKLMGDYAGSKAQIPPARLKPSQIGAGVSNDRGIVLAVSIQINHLYKPQEFIFWGFSLLYLILSCADLDKLSLSHISLKFVSGMLFNFFFFC
jgi:hypothetical protein